MKSFTQASLTWIPIAVISVSLPISAAVVTSCDEAGLRAALAAGNSVTFGCDGTIILSNAISLTTAVSIDSGGHNVGISGGGKVRIFEIGIDGVVRLKGLKLIDGFARGADGAPAAEGRGGGVLVSEGQLHATDCALVNNLTVGGAGVEFPGAAAYGGAIFVTQGTLRLTNCSLMLNTSRGGTGGSTPFIGTEAKGGDGYGAAVSARNSDVIVVDSELGGNRAEGGDSGFVGNSSAPPGSARGGAWHQVDGTSTFVRPSFRTNVATAPVPRQGGGLPSNASGGNASAGGLAVESGTAVVDDGVFENNRAVGGRGNRNGNAGLGAGGAIHNAGTLELRRCVIRGNAAVAGDFMFDGNDALGGGIHNIGALTLRDSLVEANLASNGKQYSFSMIGFRESGNPYGGGLWNGGTAHLLNSTVSANVSDGPDASMTGFVFRGFPAFGGGICNAGQLTAVNLTLSGNVARGGSDGSILPLPTLPAPAGDALGGGIYQSQGTTSLTNVTVALNEAIGGIGTPVGGRLGENFNIASGGFSLVNSIVAQPAVGSNCVGIVTDGGHNISSDSSCQFTATGSLNNTDPKLGRLDYFGGPTPTMPLLAGSPAIDTANSASCPPTDQRRRTRPSGAGCDIGAFESSAPFAVFGMIAGWNVTGANIEVSSGDLSTPLSANATYVLNGLAAGSHTVVPSSPTSVFIQSNAFVTLGPDKLVNFHSYRSNAVTLEMNFSPGTHRVVFAGETGRTYILSGSSNLPTWTPLKTNVMSSSQIFDYFETDAGSPSHHLFKVESP